MIDKGESLTLEDLLSKQSQDFESLKKYAVSLRTLQLQKRKKTVLNPWVKNIRHIWMQCQERNAQIYRAVTVDDKVDLPYFNTMEFGTMKTVVFETLYDIAEHVSAQEQPPGVEQLLRGVKRPPNTDVTVANFEFAWDLVLN
ncbi:hypothetical protein PUN28_020541 [Cardiocondyla obscurior]|uniref:Uncharacterized protein n=1 Tax=Cardiocondyla obscurior TaxID=286306 RepID=A0AAW2E6K3_9HYME